MEHVAFAPATQARSMWRACSQAIIIIIIFLFFIFFLLFLFFFIFIIIVIIIIRGTQREYSSKPLKHNIVKRILVFKR